MKKLLALVLGLTLVMSFSTAALADEEDESTITASFDAATMSITVPMDIAIHVDSMGFVTCPDECCIENNSNNPVYLVYAWVTGANSWTAVYPNDDTVPMNKKEFSVSINGFGLSDEQQPCYEIIDGQSNYDLGLSVDIPGRVEAMEATKIGVLCYSFDWYSSTYSD